MAGSFISWESICKGVAAQTEVSQHDKSTIIHERHHSSKYLSRYQLASSLFLQTAHASRVILKEDYPVSVCNGRGLLAICSEVFFPLTELCCFLKSEAPDSDNASGCTVYVKGRGTTCKTEERQTESEENSFDWL